MSKKIIRETYLKKRLMMSKKEYESRCQRVVSNFFDFIDISEQCTVHCFLPIIKQREVDTWPIVEKLCYRPKNRVVLSRASLVDNTMEHIYYEPGDELVTNQWGIPEPIKGMRAVPKDIDVVIIPLIVFDLKGMRVGYGKGYYDRFLEACRPEVLKIGLSLTPPLDEIPGILSHDIPMNHCITPLGGHSFK